MSKDEMNYGTVDERLRVIEHAVGLVPGPGNPLGQGLAWVFAQRFADMREHHGELVKVNERLEARISALEQNAHRINGAEVLKVLVPLLLKEANNA